MSTAKTSPSFRFQELICCVFIVLIPLVYNPKLLDIALNFRFLIASVILFGIMLMGFNKQEYTIFTYIGLLFYGWNLISVFWGRCTAEVIFESQKVFLFISAYVVFFTTLRHTDHQKILGSIVLSSAVLLLIGLVQVSKLADITTLSLYGITGLQCHKNLYASFLFLLLPFNIVYLIRSKKYRPFVMGVCILLVSMIFMVQSRAVYLGCAVSLVLLLLLSIFYVKENLGFSISKPLVLSIAAGIIICISIYGIKGYFRNNTTTIVQGIVKTESNQERLSLLTKTKQLIQDHLLLGVGAGNWQIEYQVHGLAGLGNAQMNNTTFQRPHNDFLWTLSELGIVGFLLYLFLLGFTVYSGFIYFKNKKETLQTRQEVLILLCFYIGFLTISFFDFPKERIEHLIFHALLIAFIHSLIASEFKVLKVSENKLSILSGTFLIMLVFSIYGGYKRYSGELNLTKVYMARATGNWEKLVSACPISKSVFYTIDPTSIPIDWYEGIGYFSMNNMPAAFQSFKHAYALNPYNFHVLNNLASTYENIGNSPKAVELYTEALRINPVFDEARLNLAAIYFNKGKTQKAYDTAIKCADSPRRQEYIDIFTKNLK